MVGCRRIYNNLLLLSVIFFSLGSVAHPFLHPGCAVDCCHAYWQEHNSPESCLSPAEYVLVYPPHHLCGTVCGDHGLILAPPTEIRLPLNQCGSAFEPFSTEKLPVRFWCRNESRAPPLA